MVVKSRCNEAKRGLSQCGLAVLLSLSLCRLVFAGMEERWHQTLRGGYTNGSVTLERSIGGSVLDSQGNRYWPSALSGAMTNSGTPIGAFASTYSTFTGQRLSNVGSGYSSRFGNTTLEPFGQSMFVRTSNW